VLTYGDIELDREKRRVARSGRSIDPGPTEYRLLEFFLEHPGRVFSREQLLDSVWGRDIYIDERTVDVHIGRPRQPLNPGRAQDPTPGRPGLCAGLLRTTLFSAQTVRDAQATGRCCLPAGKDVLITPEARGLADQLGIRLDPAINDLSVLPACCAKTAGGAKEVSEPRGEDDLAALRSAVLAKLPADAAKQPELVEQVMQKVRAAQTADVAAHPWQAASGGIKLVKESEIRLGIFEGAGAEIPPDESELHLPRAAVHARLATDFGPAELVEPIYVRAPDADRSLR